MRLSIIIIGDEILIGQVTDTNSGEIARALGSYGWNVVGTSVVADDAEAIMTAVQQAMDNSDLVITTGGLGPTKDDITKKVLTSYFGGELKLDPAVLENVETIFRKRGLHLNELTRQQALVPTSCRVIQNQLGTAPIMWFERDGKVLISMPGVPFETVGMLKAKVIEEIIRHFHPEVQYLHHTLIVSGIPESALAERLAQYEEALPKNMHLAYLPVPGYIRLRLDGKFGKGEKTKDMDRSVKQLKKLVGEYLIYDGDATPAQILLEKIKERNLTLATAESCTGGNIAHSITEVPGSSECYLGSVVSYSNSVKQHLLGVSADDLEKYGAVSEAVVRQMALGATRAIGTDCSIATSGIAGPGGGSEEKPVGTVWMAVHTPNGTESAVRRFPGDRHRVIERATTEAILMLIRNLE